MLLALRSVDRSTWEPKTAFLMTAPTGIGQLDEYDTRKRINLWLVDSPIALPTAVPTSPKCEIPSSVCVLVCGVLYGPAYTIFISDNKTFHRIL